MDVKVKMSELQVTVTHRYTHACLELLLAAYHLSGEGVTSSGIATILGKSKDYAKTVNASKKRAVEAGWLEVKEHTSIGYSMYLTKRGLELVNEIHGLTAEEGDA